MKIQWILAMIALATAPVATVYAQTAELAPSATYAFTCDSTSPLSLAPVSFNFQVANVLNIGSQGSGAGAGKVTFNPLTIRFRADSSYTDLLRDLESGAHYSACTLTETVPARFRGKSGSGSSTVLTWNFRLVYLSSLTAIGSDASNRDSGGTNVPTGYLEAGFEYGAVSSSVSQ